MALSKIGEEVKSVTLKLKMALSFQLWKTGTLLGVYPIPCSHDFVHVLGNCHSRTNQRHFSHNFKKFSFVSDKKQVH